MIISEIFYSIQGEGFLAGVPSTFIRLAGCPLRCKWCDTKYAWNPDAGSHMTTDSIIKAIDRYPTRHTVVTGGEPMINEELPDLTHALSDKKKHITIETAGIAFVPNLNCDLMSISPKLASSHAPEPDDTHANSPLDISVLGELITNYPYQLKFVIDSEDDLDDVLQILNKLPNLDRDRVMLMPQAATRQQYLERAPIIAQLCKNAGLAFSQRLHVMLYDKARGR